MKLLAISNPKFIPDEAEIINSLFREGLVCLHIRKPESDEKDFANLLSQIEPDFLEKTSIHQHHRLAEEFGITRLHFTESKRSLTSTETLDSLVKEGFSLSTSIHEFDALENLPKFFNYTFFGPVFNSISKSGYKSVVQENFVLADDLKKVPVIALGGIDHTNLEKVREMNFDGAAVLGTLWNEPKNVIAKFRELRDVVYFMNKHRNHYERYEPT